MRACVDFKIIQGRRDRASCIKISDDYCSCDKDNKENSFYHATILSSRLWNYYFAGSLSFWEDGDFSIELIFS